MKSTTAMVKFLKIDFPKYMLAMLFRNKRYLKENSSFVKARIYFYQFYIITCCFPFSGSLSAMGITWILCSTGQCDFSRPGRYGHWPYLFLHGGYSTTPTRRAKDIEDT